MRDSQTYRGAKRNMARRQKLLGQWRERGAFAANANVAADLEKRAAQANSARKVASKALVEAKTGVPAVIMLNAFLAFYRAEPRTRVASRIVRDLVKQKRAA